MTIVSWNVNGLRAIVKKDIINALVIMNPDIICLQETKAQIEDVATSLNDFSDYNIYSNPADRKGYAGTVLLSKTKPIAVVNDMGIKQHDAEGRIVCAEYIYFYLVNVYTPNSGQKLQRLTYRKKWDQDFLKFLKNLQEKKPIIVAGDFNVAHQPIDLKNDLANYNKVAGYTQIEIDGMEALLQSGLVDVFRILHPKDVAYTYWSYRSKGRERNIGWRIDYFLTSSSLVKKVTSIKIASDWYGSDHCPVIMEIKI